MDQNPLMSLFRQSEKDRRPYSQTLEKGMLWPVVKNGYTGKPEWSSEGGLLGSAIDAFTLPGRVYNGEVAPDDPGEMLNFVGNVMGGGVAANMRRGVNPGVASMSGAQPPKQQGIRAYHGSPHNFDEFSLDKIGTGEGAQAYGHGLYFAEREGVAKSYRDALADPRKQMAKPLTKTERDIQAVSAKYVQEFGADDVYSLRQVIINDMEHERLPANALEAFDDMVSSGRMPGFLNNGKMYEVNIKADPADFLDWDKPLSQQSEKVRGALAGVEPSTKGSAAYDQFARRIAPPPSDGADWSSVVNVVNDGGTPKSRVSATQALREAGIPGIRYLDQVSRAAGEGSSNYVVFDDKFIEILRKYGLLGGVVGGGAMAGGTDAQAGQ